MWSVCFLKHCGFTRFLGHQGSHAAEVVHRPPVANHDHDREAGRVLQSLDLHPPSPIHGLPAGGLALVADPILEATQDLIVDTLQAVG